MSTKLCEGNRPFSAVNGQATSASDMNTMSDQLADMLGPQWILCMTGFHDASLSDAWVKKTNPTYCYWKGTTDNVDQPILWLWLPLRSGQKITEVSLVLYVGAGGGNNGEIGIYSRSKTQVLDNESPTQVLDIGGSNPWASGSNLFEINPSCNITIAENTQYYIKAQVSDDAGNLDNDIRHAAVKAQFGN